MKKAIVTIILSVAIISEAYAGFTFIGQNGSNLSTDGTNFQVGGNVNGNQVQIGNNGFSISGPGGSLSIGNASFGTNQGGIYGLIIMASKIIGMLVPVTIALAVLAFFWSLVLFIWKGSQDAKAHDDGLKGMGYSLLAIFVMISIWGIISFIGSTLGIGQGGGMPAFQLPTVK